MAPSLKKLPLLFLVAAVVSFLLAAASHPVPAPAKEKKAHHQKYCEDSLAGLVECLSYMFGGAAAPSPACCAAYAAVPLCLCYVDDGTFWRARGLGAGNATGDSFRIPASCGQVIGPPIELWCAAPGQKLPPYGPHATPAQPPATATAAAPTAPPPSGSSVAPATPSFTSPPPPPASKAKRDSSPELLMLLVAIGAMCSIIYPSVE